VRSTRDPGASDSVGTIGGCTHEIERDPCIYWTFPIVTKRSDFVGGDCLVAGVDETTLTVAIIASVVGVTALVAGIR
jgi:hypothetical protein